MNNWKIRRFYQWTHFIHPKKKVTLETKMMHKTFFKDTDKMCDFNRSFVSGRCYLLPFLAKV